MDEVFGRKNFIDTTILAKRTYSQVPSVRPCAIFSFMIYMPCSYAG